MNGFDLFHEEEALGKAYDARLMRRLLAYLKPYKGQALLALAFVLAVSFLELVGPYLTKVAIDVYIQARDWPGLMRLSLVFLVVLILRMVTGFIQAYVLQMTGQRIMYDLRSQIFGQLQRLPMRFFDTNPVGRLMTRVIGDVDVLNNLFVAGVVTVVGDVLVLLGIMGVLLWMNWRLALVSFVVLPAIFAAAHAFQVNVRVSFRDVRTKLARLNAFMQENFLGMPTVQAFCREGENFNQFDRINALHRDANLRSITAYAVFFPVVELVASVSMALMLWYGGGQALQGMLTIGSLTAFFQYARRFFQPIQDLTDKYNIVQEAMASSERVFLLLDTPVVIASPAEPHAPRLVRGEIEFKNVTFAYAEEENVLKDISFQVRQGERLAIVGATGAGKTSIINLLCRFYDIQKGSITFDGVDLRQWDLKTLRRAIGVVQQDVFLFSGSVASNIRLGHGEITDGRIRESARGVHADPFIQRMPKGYDDEIRERGTNLSVGQKQLLSFARALAYDPKVLVLDEATSSVDTETELLIQDALKVLMKGRTSLVIAHRLSTIQDCDRILVLHKGTLREQGTHQELLSQGGIYAKLYALQYKDQELPVGAALDRGR
jgi:ATP-binding cassette subfamily B multidrug efflux pump